MKRDCAAAAAALMMTMTACTVSAVKPIGIVPPTAGLDSAEPATAQDFAAPSRSDLTQAPGAELDGITPLPGVNPFDPVTLNNRAVADSEQGDYDGAMVLLERAFHLSPDNPVIAANLSKLREFRNSIGPLKPGAGGADTAVSVPPAPPVPPDLWQPGSDAAH